MKRFKNNPILSPISNHPWESRMIFNAATLYTDNRVHILYRAIGQDGVSRLGYASSSDGYHIDERLPSPIFKPVLTEEKFGCEDPRITKLNEQYFMCYTAYGSRILGTHQIAITSIAVEDFLKKNWNWRERWLPFFGVRNKDAALFPHKINGRYVLLHRIHPDICVAYSEDLKRWCDIRTIVRPRFRQWDSWKVGIAGPPIETDRGWLLIYHGVNFEKVYSLGIILLNKHNPESVTYRSQEPILQPVMEYERFGAVPNVVFSCGAVKMDDQLLIYYGGADTVLCVATYDLDELNLV
ncbi:MAG: glycosidase [Candidatus Hodarchaeota archaeon]